MWFGGTVPQIPITAADPGLPDESSDDRRVYLWRRDQFVRLGMTARAARFLADDPDADWHLMERLLRAGCPPGLARRIV